MHSIRTIISQSSSIMLVTFFVIIFFNLTIQVFFFLGGWNFRLSFEFWMCVKFGFNWGFDDLDNCESKYCIFCSLLHLRDHYAYGWLMRWVWSGVIMLFCKLDIIRNLLLQFVVILDSQFSILRFEYNPICYIGWFSICYKILGFIA